MAKHITLAALEYSTALNYALALILMGGFVVAVVVGSIAWYNSKKPAGWEGAERPNWVPKVGADQTKNSKTKK